MLREGSYRTARRYLRSGALQQSLCGRRHVSQWVCSCAQGVHTRVARWELLANIVAVFGRFELLFARGRKLSMLLLREGGSAKQRTASERQVGLATGEEVPWPDMTRHIHEGTVTCANNKSSSREEYYWSRLSKTANITGCGYQMIW